MGRRRHVELIILLPICFSDHFHFPLIGNISQKKMLKESDSPKGRETKAYMDELKAGEPTCHTSNKNKMAVSLGYSDTALKIQHCSECSEIDKIGNLNIVK